MECDNQATAPVHMLKSGETVFLYYDHMTGDQDQCLERTDSSKTSSSAQASIKSTQDELCHMHSIGTQTDNDVMQGSTVALTTRNGGTKGRGTTDIKSYNSTSTETDLNTTDDRKTLESLLKWALAICTSQGDFSDQDAQTLQYSNRNTSPPPSCPHVCQRGKTTFDSQHSIDLERAEYSNSTKGNNDPSSDVVGKMLRENRRRDVDHLGRLHSSTLGLSDDMHAEETLIQSMEIEHCLTDELQSTAAISDHVQVNVPHLDRTPDKQQEPGVEIAISEQYQVAGRQQELGIGMVPLRDQLIGMHLDQHLPTYISDGTGIKEEYVINEDPVVQGVPSVGDIEAGITDSNVFNQNSYMNCTSSMSVAGKVNTSTLQSTSMATAVVSDQSCGMEMYTEPGNQSNEMERSTRAEERPYECDVYGKRYKKGDCLNTHLRIHVNDKSFQCDVCGKKFAVKNNIKIHMRVHSQEKPYACTICKRRFTQSGHLKNHMHVHTGERPYNCQVCSKRFSLKHHLDRHLRVHSREKK